MSEPPLLRIEHLTRGFGGIRAVEDVSLELSRGSVFGIIGPNGAGKTTLVNLLSGLTAPTSGSIWFQGRRIHGLPPHVIASLGITRTYQNIKLFRTLSARQNVIIGQHLNRRATLVETLVMAGRARQEERRLEDRADELLAEVGLAGKGDLRADFLAYGDARRLEIARALGSGPALLLLDEPAAGMNQAEVEQIASLIRQLAAMGHTVLLIEHHVGLVMEVCQRIAVLNFGVKIAEGTPAEVQVDPAVIEAYLGRD